MLTPRSLQRTVVRLGAAAQNALEVARFGGLDTGEESSPYEEASQIGIARLRHYFPGRDDDRPVVLLVPPLMLTAEVWDVSPATSAVRALATRHVDPWVVDFGSPEHVAGGLERTLADHVVTVSEAVEEVRDRTGRDVHLAGYSQGGMFCYQAAAYRRSDGIASVIAFGSPVDVHRRVPFGLPEEPVTRLVATLARTLFSSSAVPSWMSRTGFKLLDPIKTVRSQVDFVRQLHDRESLLEREPQRRFLDGEGFIAWPGPALAEFAEQFIAHNRMLSGGFVIGGRLVTLADVTCPVLAFVGEVDEIANPPSVRAIGRAAPRASVYERALHAGHFGLVVGSKASEWTWPTVADWIRWCEDGGDLPAEVQPMAPEDAEAVANGEAEPGLHLGYGLELAANVGAGVARSVVRAVGRGGRTVRSLAEDALDTLPRLARLERVRSGTRISLGLLLDEQAGEAPDATFFLFDGRGHTYADAKRRIDNIVRGLVSVGVRQGEHVGVLMDTRPSALALVAALNRLGAVTVMLRPGGSLERELELGQVRRVIADPEHADGARAVADVPVLVLGGGGEPRELGFGLTDMERIDPDEIDLPGWYQPNPGTAGDLAFVLFTGKGERTRVNRITNGRWSLSAFGTASAAHLDRTDTVYAITPIHHPSGLLVSIGGGIAGGARLALASSTDFDPEIFWDEVRRYGVTVVSYTWTLLRGLVDAPPDPAERHHPIRLFVGSGMPSGLWRRIVRRFGAGVVEFYASTEGGAVLGNLTGRKVGAKGRPIPGSVDVAVAAWDPVGGRLLEGDDGFARRCAPGEVGMLLARADDDRGSGGGSPLRGVFARGDAWTATGDLFTVDEDGDHWMVDHAASVIRTSAGPVGSIPVEDALGTLDAVDLGVVYGVRPRPEADEVVVAALTLRDTLDGDDLAAAVAHLDAAQRPTVVRVLDELPMTTWHRPRKAPLRAEGIPAPTDDLPVWRWDDEATTYVPLDGVARAALVG